MKSLFILRLLLQDAESIIGSHETDRDWLTIQTRFEHEGESFLMITLPTFSSWLEQSLENGSVVPSIFQSFHRKEGPRDRSLPAFLLGLTSRVFDSHTGLIRSDADPSCVYFIRQICSSFKKVRSECSRERRDDTVEKFVETDRLLPKRIVLDTVTRSVANYVISSLKYSDRDSVDPCFPKHGPGATAEKLWGNQKYTLQEYYTRWIGRIDIEELYGVQPLQDAYTSIKLISEKHEVACRLALVPKTLKAPRTIAVEPTAMQYAQQLVSARLIAAMSKSSLTRHIKFTDQSINNLHAREGSRGGSQSTIDLSEASDRVGASLVREIVRSDPRLREQLFAVRSTRIRIGNQAGRASKGRTIVLRKFSTSGSAVTFPVETLVFFILALSALVRSSLSQTKEGGNASHASESLTSAIHRLSTEVSVYGDDIVVPKTYCNDVCHHLESYGLKVNFGKTFSKGSFRESCGGDYFLGEKVTPVYLRQLLPDTLRDGVKFASAVSYSNQLYLAGCWKTADWVKRQIDMIARLPLVQRTSPGLGWYTFKDAHDFSHKRTAYGEYVVSTFALRAKALPNAIDGYDALRKALISARPFEDPEHLLSSVPQYSATLRRVLVTPY